jgi:hypothetical protein
MHHCITKNDYCLYLPEQHHNIIEIDPSIPVEIKCTHWFIRRNPLHLVEHEDDIVEVLAVVGVQVFVETVFVGIGGRGLRPGKVLIINLALSLRPEV